MELASQRAAFVVADAHEAARKIMEFLFQSSRLWDLVLQRATENGPSSADGHTRTVDLATGHDRAPSHAKPPTRRSRRVVERPLNLRLNERTVLSYNSNVKYFATNTSILLRDCLRWGR